MKITVLYQNYNQSEYIEESMSAILNQTYKAHEIIMFDDCSQDNSLEIFLYPKPSFWRDFIKS